MALALHRSGLSRIEFQIGEGQGFTALLLIVVILVDDPRPTPFPEDAPAQCATSAGRSDQIKCPGRMRLACSISGDRGLSNGYQQTTDFGHGVQREQEIEEKRAHFRLSANCPSPAFA